MRIAKTFTVEESLLAEVERTKGTCSTSERVNQLLKLALEREQQDELEREAARFYSVANREARKEARVFQTASKRSLAKERCHGQVSSAGLVPS
jgi:hypothetical protein